MEVDLGEFRYVFLLDSLYGTCTVSLTTLEQSKCKVMYSATLITVYATEIIVYFKNQMSSETHEPLIMIISRIMVQIMPLYSLTMAIIDFKSKISAALNLQGIEGQLESLNVSVPNKTVITAINVLLIMTNIVNQTYKFVSHFVIEQHHLPLTTVITSFQLIGTDLGQGFSILLFLTKILVIQRAIRNGLSDIIQSHLESQSSDGKSSRNQRKRFKKTKSEATKKWVQLTNLQGSLQDVEATVRNTFWVQIICYRLFVEVVGIMGGMTLAERGVVSLPILYSIRMSLLFLGIIFAVMRMEHEKKEPFSIIPCELEKAGMKRNHLKRQMLAKIHRSISPFSCAFFDVNYALLLTVLENSVLVITSMFSYFRHDS